MNTLTLGVCYKEKSGSIVLVTTHMAFICMGGYHSS